MSHLGKRKRDARPAKDAARVKRPAAAPATVPVRDEDEDAMRAAFARAFEKKFAPLEGNAARVKGSKKQSRGTDEDEEEVEEVEDMRSASEDENSDDDNGFQGFSSEDGVQEPEVVSYQTARERPLITPGEKRAFMSSKVPALAAAKDDARKSWSQPKPKNKDDSSDDEATNLKNDLSLQRLLNESHLLHPSAQVKAKASRQQRQKVTDLRLQALGAASLLREEKMPMAMRKGIVEKKSQKEVARRREAKENGIVLERERREPPKKTSKRERSVGGPTVGRFKGGTLTLGKGDLRKITGGGDRKRGKKDGKRRSMVPRF